MKLFVHSAERVGPVNIGAGANDYFHKVFGTGTNDKGEFVQATILVNKTEYEGHVQALLSGQESVASVHPSAVTAIVIDKRKEQAKK